jgi:hypothetical protein
MQNGNGKSERCSQQDICKQADKKSVQSKVVDEEKSTHEHRKSSSYLKSLRDNQHEVQPPVHFHLPLEQSQKEQQHRSCSGDDPDVIEQSTRSLSFFEKDP